MAGRRYLDFEDYQRYGGTLSEPEFMVAELKARKRLDVLTACRIQSMEEVPDEVKISVYTLIKAGSAVGVDAQVDTPLVTGYTTDGYSESFGSPTEQMKAIQKEGDAEVRNLLYGVTDDHGVPLLYRGLDL